ncbi:MAG: sugar nucleotide-binding protein, partial [Pontimonas sp.]
MWSSGTATIAAGGSPSKLAQHCRSLEQSGALMTRILLTGAGGMLGHDLQAVLADYDLTAMTRVDLDITDQEAVNQAISGHEVVVNAAAY